MTVGVGNRLLLKCSRRPDEVGRPTCNIIIIYEIYLEIGFLKIGFYIQLTGRELYKSFCAADRMHNRHITSHNVPNVTMTSSVALAKAVLRNSHNSLELRRGRAQNGGV